MNDFSKREVLQAAVATGSSVLLPSAFAQDVAKVGILLSLTGAIALAEASGVDAEKLAIEEINAPSRCSASQSTLLTGSSSSSAARSCTKRGGARSTQRASRRFSLSERRLLLYQPSRSKS
jgi:Periplasmic binding protein domain